MWYFTQHVKHVATLMCSFFCKSRRGKEKNSFQVGLRFLYITLLLYNVFPSSLNFTYGSLVPGKQARCQCQKMCFLTFFSNHKFVKSDPKSSLFRPKVLPKILHKRVLTENHSYSHLFIENIPHTKSLSKLFKEKKYHLLEQACKSERGICLAATPSDQSQHWGVGHLPNIV